jgi:urea transport system permease protein
MKSTLPFQLLLIAFCLCFLPIKAFAQNDSTPEQDSEALLSQTSVSDAGIQTEAEFDNETKEAVNLESLSARFVGAKLKEVASIVDEIEALNDPNALPIFNALLKGDLYYTKTDKILVIAEKIEGSKDFAVKNALTGETAENLTKKQIRKVKTNNRLRSNLRTKIARMNLFADDVELRKKAVLNITENLSEENAELLKEANATEKNAEVIDLIKIAKSVFALDAGSQEEKLDAIQLLEGSLEPIVRNKLTAIANDNDDPVVTKAATEALKSIEGKVKFYGYLETFFFGLSLGSVLLLVAAGLAITFGVMGVINMAHGEMIMLGAYTTYVVQLLMPNNIALSIFVAIPAAFCVSALFGILIERGVIQFLKGRPLETLLATFGISLLLQQLVRTIFSPLNRQVSTPEFMSGALEINAVFALNYNRLYILFFALLVFFLLQLVLKKTSLGLHVRAVSQNRDMAKAMGVRTEWVDAMTFGLGSGVAGLAGVALSQITNVGPNLGQSYIIDSFMVVVFGGVGNLWGMLVGGFSLGVLNKFMEPITGAVLANIIVLIGIILFIQKKPRGLFPQKGRAAES